MFTRRLLLKILCMAGLYTTLNRSSALAGIFFKPEKKEKPRISEDLFGRDGVSPVGVAGGEDPEEMIREAVSLIGGFERLGLKGKTVLIKPNIVSGKPNPTTTNPEVVGALVKILFMEGAREVFVGDMSALLTLSTKRNMSKIGIKDAAEKEGAKTIVFEDYDWIEVPLPGARYIDRAYVTEWLYRVDIIINLPVIKTHRSASYTISLKNFIGCTHLKQRPYLVDSRHWEELVAEFNLAYRPDLNIVDGTVSMVEGGPWEGRAEDTNIIIASADRIAADIIGLGVIKSYGRWAMVTEKDVWEQRQIKRALELNIGKGKDGIRLITGNGDARFNRLMEDVKRFTGLG